MSLAGLWSMMHAGVDRESGGWQLGAKIGSVLWAVHPLRVEVVCWLSCQPYLLATAFILLGLLRHVSRALTSQPVAQDLWQQRRGRLQGQQVVSFVSTQALWCCETASLSTLAVLSKAAALPCVGLFLALDLLGALRELRVSDLCCHHDQKSPQRIPRLGWWASRPSDGSDTWVERDKQPVWAEIVTVQLPLLALKVLTSHWMSFLIAFWATKRAVWANDVGMRLTQEHPQNALKIPRHISMEGMTLGLEEVGKRPPHSPLLTWTWHVGPHSLA